MLNLTPEEASRICMDECRAMCCRGPLILRLEPDEVAVFHREAVHLGTTADISPRVSIRRRTPEGPEGWMPKSGPPMRCGGSSQRRWRVICNFVAGSARRLCATEVQ